MGLSFSYEMVDSDYIYAVLLMQIHTIPLLAAADSGHREIVDLLLKKNAYVNKKDIVSYCETIVGLLLSFVCLSTDVF